MKKQGFTLIELMVVIVIMGILAAVAVPKLFGMIAKSKASEVGPAAGTYVKLQQAFVSETGTDYGSFKLIGYSAPGTNSQTTNFTYTDEAGAGTHALPTSAEDAWKATSRVQLNDCTTGGTWTVTIAKANGGNAADAAVFDASVSGTGCEELTPSFNKIGH